MCFIEYYNNPVVDQYSKQIGIKNPLYKTGGVAKQKQMRSALRVKKLQPGDIFIMVFPDGSGHCGFVERVEGNVIITIEGNSNEESNSMFYDELYFYYDNFCIIAMGEHC